MKTVQTTEKVSSETRIKDRPSQEIENGTSRHIPITRHPLHTTISVSILIPETIRRPFCSAEHRTPHGSPQASPRDAPSTGTLLWGC